MALGMFCEQYFHYFLQLRAYDAVLIVNISMNSSYRAHMIARECLDANARAIRATDD